MDHNLILTALAYGLLPALAWLVFWLTADRANPEPKRLIAAAFLAGMLAVPVSIVIEIFFEEFLRDGVTKIFAWSLTEEVVKYFFAFIFVLRNKEFDEPIDALIYMICVALGFAALENILYVLTPLTSGEHINAATLTNMRFIGATLLHTISSASVGIAMAFTFYKPKITRIHAVIFGLLIATSLHTLFNFFIMELSDSAVFMVFASVWVLALGIIVIAEKIKRIDA